MEHLAIEKNQGVQRLVLSRSRDPPLRRQMPQKLPDLGCPHGSRMPPSLASGLRTVPEVEQVPMDPLPVSLFRPTGVVEEPHYFMNLLAQWSLRIRDEPFLRPAITSSARFPPRSR